MIKKIPSLLLAFLFFSTSLLFAQPGNWFGDLTTSDNSSFVDAGLTDRGNVRATAPMQAEVTKTDAKFLFTTSPGVWSPKWCGSTSNFVRTTNARLTDADAAFIYSGGGWDHDLEVAVTSGNYYTFIIGENTDANNDISILETTYLPVEIERVDQDAFIVEENQEVTVSVEFSSALNADEYAFLHYTTDNWGTSALLTLTQENDSIYTATIPGQSDETEVFYTIHTSIHDAPAIADLEYLSLRSDNNFGNNYSYEVGYTVTCGSQIGVVTSEPAFPLEDGPVTIFFNAEMGNGGLVNYEGDVYIHSGVITNESENSTDWKYVLSDWGENTAETLMDSLDENLYQLDINSIRDYYGVPEGEQILKVAMVFRSDEPIEGDSYLEGKNADGSDIFVDVYELDLNVKILSPSKRNTLAPAGSIIPVCVEALENQNITLYLNGSEIYTDDTSSVTYALIPTDLNPGNNWIKAMADDGAGSEVYDSVSVYMRQEVVVEELPDGAEPGVNYIDDTTVTLVLHDAAAQKEFAFAIGEYSLWQPNDNNYMKRTPDGQYFWVTLTDLQPGKEYAYQYFIDGTMKLADPRSQKILDPWNDQWIPETNYPELKDYPYDSTIGVVSVFETAQETYTWQVEDFSPPAVGATQQDLVVYELLIRDFLDSRSIQDLTDTLDYLKNLGVNAIELMPIMEFDGNESWGYAPNFFFATDKYYGKKNHYKAFIDSCHQRNIAVILDVVPNHAFGQCPMVQMYFDEDAGEHGQPAAENPWFNQTATHPYNVGYDFNHESPYTRQFFKDVLEYWLTEFKVDGFRVDLSKGLTQTNSGDDINAWSSYDQSRINILTDYYNHVKSVNSNAYFILEHFANNDEETVLANTGMLLWGNMDTEFKQTILGYESESDLSWAYYGNRGWNYPNAVVFMESHDEERQMYEAYNFGNSSGDYDITEQTTALERMEMANVLMYSIPGPKMLWQFGELGYDYSIHYGGDRTAPKPPRWDYWNDPNRQKLYRTTAAIIDLQKHEAFRQGSFNGDLSGLGKRMWISHSSMNVVVLANMNVTSMDMYPSFQNSGKWYDYFAGDSIEVTDPSGHLINMAPGEYKVFTTQRFEKPFHSINFTVKDANTETAISNAFVSLTGLGTDTTDAAGYAWFTSNGGSVNYRVEASGYLTSTGTVDIPETESLEVLLETDPNSITEKPAALGKLYPNPVKNQLIIEGYNGYQLSLYNIYGQKMQQKSINANRITIDTQSLHTGVYFVKCSTKKQTFTHRIVVE